MEVGLIFPVVDEFLARRMAWRRFALGIVLGLLAGIGIGAAVFA